MQSALAILHQPSARHGSSNQAPPATAMLLQMQFCQWCCQHGRKLHSRANSCKASGQYTSPLGAGSCNGCNQGAAASLEETPPSCDTTHNIVPTVRRWKSSPSKLREGASTVAADAIRRSPCCSSWQRSECWIGSYRFDSQPPERGTTVVLFSRTCFVSIEV
jgi:hypothetical protein